MTTNMEPQVSCHLCHATRPAKAIVNHVRLSDDNRHGKRGEIPSNFDVRKCKTVGYLPDSSKTQSEDHDRYVCTDCGQVCKGRSGLGVHIRRTDDEWHESLGDDEPIDYDRHTRLPSVVERREILVPSTNYRSSIKLTESEKEAGWNVRVDDSLVVRRPPTGTAGDQVSWSVRSPHTEEVLTALRKELGEYLEEDQDLDPTEVYDRVRSIINAPA